MMETLVDDFGRRIRYVRLSVTDRCDFRCVYCMSEEMTFLPRDEVLSLEEIALLARAFVELGVEKIRLTGGEPLVRRDIGKLVDEIGALEGLKDFSMTTNGAGLAKHAAQLKAAGMSRLNISLDSLDPERFKALTRTGDLNKVIAGIRAAREEGFRIKLNAVVLKGRNDHEVVSLVEFAREEGLDISFIEEMPLGQVSDHGRDETFCSSDDVQARIETRYPLIPTLEDSLGPARYFRMADSESRVGFISPHSHNFCSTCNRVRVTVEGRLLLCLGNEHSLDLRDIMRRHPGDIEPLKAAIIDAMHLKPERHHFTTDGDVQIVRFMNMTGG
ncbi:MAG: GTP 3',8-cyclase MoaA [Cobetia sp.]|jgi:cyclic pyranopterin phosphate synthase|uniref:GTP 3',8-cyclase n=2 Tax=Cobetia TaxID=204286 RepID=A0AAP4TYE6_9GAMM|nr:MULTISPECIES: GTP 3',8-cyclase MoaA [Cobetia]AVV35064.1 GTP 3',8-cyclase MoaA [Halomonas sp. SF2003]MBR9756133.1 GTP 3',8-cyclase MoaA [Gammaproteobacteria bacterium]TCJ26628.1 GTP 3',8-cyclase MoaA [Halomonas sp. GDM18]UTV86521.1 GTP 3',8-cyclase MoaA [Cobetia litoralis]KPM79606.1 cyclic pyranopterin phosphate synthase MoaA [Cobetia sp. UCD-24C]|tara:strand:- start:1499 stop:2488 length:990 start_codon:yes stop_codon:yes gene_type:complete